MPGSAGTSRTGSGSHYHHATPLYPTATRRCPGVYARRHRYANRNDVPVLPSARFPTPSSESIHLFTDGNGRTGRALINSILRRRKVTTSVVVPLASALVAHRDRYLTISLPTGKGIRCR